MARIWKVAVVDRDESTRSLLRGLFIERGYRIRLYPSAELALNGFETKGLPDSMVLDYWLPDMEGSIFLALVVKRWAPIPTILTGISIPPHTGYLLGVRGFLSKPYDATKLEEMVASTLMREHINQVYFMRAQRNGT